MMPFLYHEFCFLRASKTGVKLIKTKFAITFYEGISETITCIRVRLNWWKLWAKKLAKKWPRDDLCVVSWFDLYVRYNLKCIWSYCSLMCFIAIYMYMYFPQRTFQLSRVDTKHNSKVLLSKSASHLHVESYYALFHFLIQQWDAQDRLDINALL